MIDYATQLKKFCKITQQVNISPNAQALYLQLLSLFDSNYYPERLKISNEVLYKRLAFSRQKLTRARFELRQAELLYYIPGAGSAPGEYQLIDLSKMHLKDLQNEIKYIKVKEPEIDNLTALEEQLEVLPEADKVWAHYITGVLKKALYSQQTGIFAGSYTAVQTFITASYEISTEFICKLIVILSRKPDIQNLEAYILGAIVNFVKDNKGRLKIRS